MRSWLGRSRFHAASTNCHGLSASSINGVPLGRGSPRCLRTGRETERQVDDGQRGVVLSAATRLGVLETAVLAAGQGTSAARVAAFAALGLALGTTCKHGPPSFSLSHSIWEVNTCSIERSEQTDRFSCVGKLRRDKIDLALSTSRARFLHSSQRRR